MTVRFVADIDHGQLIQVRCRIPRSRNGVFPANDVNRFNNEAYALSRLHGRSGTGRGTQSWCELTFTAVRLTDGGPHYRMFFVVYGRDLILSNRFDRCNTTSRRVVLTRQTVAETSIT